ncbi:OmpA family protein [Eudoraea adriatica]|uniref:OmpA family protein n=1 Tax=Eudoraea adriatica TaxID=446681 RepID=UPI0003644ED2|nr:OmpA family protein [Eudoraea adriatica]
MNKKLIQAILAFLTLITIGVSAHANELINEYATADVTTPGSDAAFRRSARANGIPTRLVKDFSVTKNGYYIIAGVYGDRTNAEKFVKKLKLKQLNPLILTHPVSNLNYVSLAQFENWKQAINSCSTEMNGKYNSEVWIMDVQGSSATIKTRKAGPENKKLVVNTRYTSKEFIKAAKENKIAARIVPRFKGLKNGYYIVAGVFGDIQNVKSFQNKLSKRNLVTKVATHSESGLNYVYLQESKDWKEAIRACKSNLNGSYADKVWIMNVFDPDEMEVTEDLLIAESKAKAVTESLNISDPNNYNRLKGSGTMKKGSSVFTNDKLLQKADSYFSKMWYAEAAELYEKVLEQDPNNQSFKVMEKAGDSHYFNTNMERAYYWYDKLYTNFKDEMSAENIFKYAHSSKGTGKYARAKRLMRLYDKEVKKGNSRTLDNLSRATPNEIVLDNILNAEETISIANLAVNTKYSDFSPMYYNEDQMVFSSAMDSSFFNTRRYKWNNQPFLDLYVAKLNKESQEVKDAVKFSKKINTKYHEASVTFSPDNQTMYFTRNNYGKKLKRNKNGINNLKIYMSKKIDGEWTEATELPFNSDDFSTGHPALSPDGKQLYFVSDMPGSIGMTDIFVVDVLGDGQFSEPRNLGPEINTERKEMFPFINEKKLFFSSDGHVGLGGLDIYEVAFNDEVGFLEVRNAGKPINSKKDDFSYIVDEETQKGFFASNRRGGKGDDDIYSFQSMLPEETNENAIAGVVTDLVTGDVMPEALIVLLDENNIKLKEVVTGEDGSFVFEDLESNTKYSIKTIKDDYFEDKQAVVTKENELVQTEVALKKLKELIAIENGIKKLKIDMIFFDFDRFYIRKDAANELDKLVEVMNEYETMVIKIESHTDSRGKRAYNKYLSDKRAKSTRDYLISRGISPGRIESAIGYGEERLLNECDGTVRCTSAKHQLNRRSEFIIVKM